jgi:hypothetical protein
VLTLAGGLVEPRAYADPSAQTVTGVPQQVIPTYLETGVPQFSIAPGQPVSAGAGSGSGSGTGGSASGGGTAVLDTLLAQSWGNAAVANAQALGVNPDAIAATCVLESGCQNLPAQNGSTVSGAFQFTNATYNAEIAAAVAQDPSLAESIVPGLDGKLDPATEAAAAAAYLEMAAQSLQAAGIADPTVLDTRGYYNFGPAYGAALAQAADDQTMASVLTGYSSSVLTANGITPGETVGQWRAGVTAKIGSAAGEPVLGSGT